jgi:flagellin
MAQADFTRIATNIGALNALNSLKNVNYQLAIHQQRLATGKRINRAADDAAGWTISSTLGVKTSGLGVALDNIGSAKNLMSVAEGHLSNIRDILAEMKAKAQQAANDTLGTDERNAILAELQDYNTQIDSEVAQATWSGVDILSTDKHFQIGVGTSTNEELTFNVAEFVWSNGTSTTFNSAGLDVTASSSTVRTAATTANTATLNVGFGATPLATSATLNSLASELDTGHYTIEISSDGAGSLTNTITISVRDGNGDLVTIDADGASGGAVGTSLSTTFDGASSTNPAAVNLGVGIVIDLNNVATGAAGSAIMHVDYAQGGQAVDSMANAQDFMDQIDAALQNVNDGLTYVGNQVNRLTFQEQSLTIAKLNTEASYNQIMNADMALEQLEATKLTILQQTATAMLAQANAAPQGVLSLFR